MSGMNKTEAMKLKRALESGNYGVVKLDWPTTPTKARREINWGAVGALVSGMMIGALMLLAARRELQLPEHETVREAREAVKASTLGR